MKVKKVVIIALGNRNSGKSNTWYEFFGRRIRTGYKKISLDNNDCRVFVKNSSFEETRTEIGEHVFVRNASFEEWGDEAKDFFIKNKLPSIIFCSVQYKEKGIETINFFKNQGYYLYIQWLNPGYKDNEKYDDHLNFEEKFKDFGEFNIVEGTEKENRVVKIKEFLVKWYRERN